MKETKQNLEGMANRVIGPGRPPNPKPMSKKTIEKWKNIIRKVQNENS